MKYKVTIADLEALGNLKAFYDHVTKDITLPHSAREMLLDETKTLIATYSVSVLVRSHPDDSRAKDFQEKLNLFKSCEHD